MRLCYCYHCQNLEKIDDVAPGTPTDYDAVLQNWIDRHMHGLHLDVHPGGRMFAFDDSRENIDRSMPSMVTGRERDAEGLSALEAQAVMEVRKELAKNHIEINDYRDQLRTDATDCFRKHHNPEAITRPCIDYHSGSKRLGRKDTPPKWRQYLCTYCPYTSSITVEVRRRRGDYAS